MVHENTTMNKKTASSDIVVAASGDSTIDNGAVKRLGGFDTLEPGTYWRATGNIEVNDRVVVQKDDVHLLMDVHLVLGDFHSVKLLSHPRDGADHSIHIPIEKFWAGMEPCYNATEVRQQEQAQVMKAVADIQEEIVKTGANPMDSPEVRAAAEKALKELEEKLSREALMAPESVKMRKDNLAKIHRRAARRSEAAGNPIAVRHVVVSDSVNDMIGQKVTSDGLAELQHESRRRAVIAEAAGRYLSQRTEQMGKTLKALTPYYAEQTKVALAKSKGAISRAEEILSGLESLKLYTGDGCEVVTVVTGEGAPPSEKLALFQAKKFMDESLCLFADLDMSFDWESQKDFFDALKVNTALRDLVLPTPRCVVSMAVTRRRLDYSQYSDARLVEAMIQNQSVFLLVRNGDNVHAVYSSQPSHEAAKRLFPTTADLQKPFMGMDGTQLKLDDLKFVQSAAEFDEMALHYKRFLVLLCGLDHREKLFGDFYPEDQSLRFMSLDFQSKYFDFIRDDDESAAIGNGMLPVQKWFAEKNKSLCSGSRLVAVLELVATGSPGYKRRRFSVKLGGLKTQHGRSVSIARREGEHHFIEIAGTTAGYGAKGESLSFKCWLDREDSPVADSGWLCLDAVLPSEINHYLNSRNARAAGGIGNILTLKLARQQLLDDDQTQQALRAFLRKSVLDNKVLNEDGLDDKILLAINTWRSANRGAPAPEVHELPLVKQILNLLYPKERLAPTLKTLVESFCARVNRKPLLLVSTGKDKKVLYATSTPEEVATVDGAMHWGWVNRISLSITGKAGKETVKETANKLVWPVKDKMPADELVICDWHADNAGVAGAAATNPASSWINTYAEPCTYAEITEFLGQAKTLVSLPIGEILRAQHMALRTDGELLKDHPSLSEASNALALSMANAAHTEFTQQKYFYHKSAYFPVAAYQESGANYVHFCYMATNVLRAMAMLADAETFNTCVETALKNYKSHKRSILNETFAKHSFRFVTSSSPMKAPRGLGFCVPVGSSEPSIVNNVGTLHTHKPGGIKRRGSFFSYHNNGKRKGDGKPRHENEIVVISHSRTFERLMGVASIDRVQFYKSANKRANNIFGIGRDDIKEARRAERMKRYEPTVYAGRWVSPLVWDAKKGRAVANAHFHREITPKKADKA